MCSSLGMFGGENVLLSLAKEMRSSEFTPIIGVLRNSQNPHTEIAEEAAKHKIDHVVIPCRERLDLKTMFMIREYIFRHDIKIIHTHDYKSDFYGLIASFWTQTRIISTCHNWIKTSRRTSFYNHVDKFLLRYFDFVVAVSPLIRNILLERGIKRGKTATIYNGVCLDDFRNRNDRDHRDLRNEFGIPLGCHVVGAVGRLSPEKGFAFLLKAAKEVLNAFPNTYFLIVGDGPQRKELSGLCSSLDIGKNVIFTGIRNDIGRIYTVMDLVVISSVMEGLPMTLLEAMASHRPIISTNVGAIPQVIEHKINGLLVEPGHMMQLAAAIKDLLINKEQAETLAQKGYEKVSRHFTSRAMAIKYLDVYQRMVQ
jgi:glycosyltransferase involved in cell wall biosynthesis